MNQPSYIENLRWAHPPSAGWPLGVWLVLALAVGAAGAGLFFWLRRRRAAQAAEQADARPPHEVALEALEKLRDKLSEENYLEFIIEVSLILRVYIQDRFELRAPHRSTEEFLEEASLSDRLSTGQQEQLGLFLQQCDLVKFARRSAALQQMESLFRTARSFVQETTARREPARTPAAAVS